MLNLMQVIILPASPIANKHAPLNLSCLPWYIVDLDENFIGYSYVTYKRTVNNAIWKKSSSLTLHRFGTIPLIIFPSLPIGL